LLLDSVLVIVVVLRYTVTKLRNLKASEVLPLDHNIYIHKVLGVTIFLLSLLHTIMHICNFSKLLKITFLESNSNRTYCTVRSTFALYVR
jgi:predicted ferric reductase